MDSKNMIGGLVAGTAIGIAIGMLVAPAKGEKTQWKLNKKARKLAKDLQGVIAETTSLKGKR
jgi:gas vesicle protein